MHKLLHLGSKLWELFSFLGTVEMNLFEINVNI
jgi:hypothetical protein